MLGRKIKIISILAIIALMACSLVPIVNNGTASTDDVQAMSEEEKPKFKYVSLGDSMTVGYGLTGYYPESGLNQYGFLMDVESTYPHMLTEYLKEELSDEYNVQHVQLGMSSTRSVELRALIDDTFTGRDDLLGDDYTQDFFSGSAFNAMCAAAVYAYPELAAEYSGLDLLQQVYRTELADADLITYNSHYDFGYALSGKITDIASGGPGIDTDFSLYYEKEYVEKAKEIEQYILNYLIDFLKEQGLDLESILKIVEKIARAAVYSVISYCANFDAFMEYIMAVNPDAKVIVIDTYNMFEDLSLKISGVTVSVAGFYQTLLDVSNFYAKYCSPYALYTYHVSLDELPMVMGNEFRSGVNKEISNDAKAGLICAMGLADRAAQPSSVIMYDAFDQTGNMSLLMKYIFSSTVIDSSQIIGKDISSLMKELSDKLSTAVGYVSQEGSTVAYNEEDGSCTVSLAGFPDKVFSKDELSLIWLNLFSLSGAGVLCHPSPNGHAYIEECIEEKIVRYGILSEENKVCTNTIDANKTEDIDSAYTELYDALIGLYYEWYETYTNLEGNLDAIYQKLVELDNDWLEIFGIFALTEPVKMLHSILEEIIDGWDAIEDTILEYAGEFNEFFKQILKDLDPETIIIIVG